MYNISMRFLGIDFGLKRVGLALSDETGTLAFPHSVLPNDKKLVAEVALAAREQKVKAIVLGESKNLDGKANPLQKDIVSFKTALMKATKKPVHFEPEFWSSFQAARYQLRRPDGSRGSELRSEHRRVKEMLDASAAAIILQSFLDRMSSPKGV